MLLREICINRTYKGSVPLVEASRISPDPIVEQLFQRHAEDAFTGGSGHSTEAKCRIDCELPHQWTVPAAF